VSSNLALLGGGVLIFFLLFFMVADYGWERRKRRGLDAQVRPGKFILRSERAEYEWYSRTRYALIILLTCLNSAAVANSNPTSNESLMSPERVVVAFSAVILISIALGAIDGYWDRKRQRGLTGRHGALFWSHYWLRYPVLILATIAATKRVLQA
jgi:hypothetical protein